MSAAVAAAVAKQHAKVAEAEAALAEAPAVAEASTKARLLSAAGRLQDALALRPPPCAYTPCPRRHAATSSHASPALVPSVQQSVGEELAAALAQESMLLGKLECTAAAVAAVGAGAPLAQLLDLAGDELAAALDAEHGAEVTDPAVFRVHAAK